MRRSLFVFAGLAVFFAIFGFAGITGAPVLLLMSGVMVVLFLVGLVSYLRGD